jgi:muconate cycloisomerase
MYPIIERIETSIIDLPTIRPHHLSMAVMRQQAMVILRLFCSDGIEGLGEATTIGGLSYGEESPEGIKLAIDKYLAPAIKGHDTTNVNKAMAILDKNIQGNRFAKSAIETALLDAQGKRLGISVAQLLGGAVTEYLPVLWTLASGNTEKDIAEANELLRTGRHNTFKLKIGRLSPAADVAHAISIKKALGSDVKITVDVNQAWDEQTAKQQIAKLQDAGIDLIEQPLDKENYEGLARLTQSFNVPIMADESVTGTKDAFKLSKAFAASVFALKIAKAGGLNNVIKTAAVADAAGIALYGGTMLEGTIGTAASAHVFSTLPALAWGTELFGPLLLTDDIVKKRIEYRDGIMELPAGAGLGLELNIEKFERFKRKSN